MDASRARQSEDAPTCPEAGETALVICGHGSHLNSDSSAPVYDHAARIRETGTFAEVREAFWKEEPSLRNALRTVAATEVVIVPLFVSEGYFTDGVIPRELRLHERASDSGGDSTENDDGDERSDTLDAAKRVWYTDPVGTHPSMTDVIVERAEGITGEPDLGTETALAVIGHGTERNPKSAEAIRDHVARISDRERFAEVGALFMDQAPFVDEVLENFGSQSIVAVPLFIADGFHTREEIPGLLGLDGRYPDYENPSDVHDRRIWYAGAVGTEPSFSAVIEERALEALSRPPDADNRRSGSTDRHRDQDGSGERKTEATVARERFLGRVGRDIETKGASTWGELVVTFEAGSDAEAGSTPAVDGSSPAASPTYELRHEADRDRDPASLATHTDPYRARELARFDNGGEYRPLKAAPTLARGWRLAGLDGEELCRAVSYFYPASVENWYREAQDRLDVTHYAETAARQTGMYAPVDELSGEALDRAVRACCTDDVCLKRRVWEAGEDASGPGRAIDAPPGEGEFPCREPCSLFIAAAREFVLADRRDDSDHTDTDRPTLTETDREDLDTILTALAESPEGVTRVRDGEADEATNRYRVRYLREKLRALDGGDSDDDASDEATTERVTPNSGGED